MSKRRLLDILFRIGCLPLISVSLSARPPGYYLEVPYVYQDNNYCGPAVMAMVLGYWADSGPTHLELAAHSAPFPEKGLSGAQLRSLAHAYGFESHSGPLSEQKLKSNISAGRPVIVAVKSSRLLNQDHYLVVIGWNSEDQTWIVHDPAEGPYLQIKRASLAEMRKPHGDWALIVVLPETKTVPALIGTRTTIRSDRILKAYGAEAPWSEHFEEAAAEFELENWVAAEQQLRHILKRAPDHRYAQEFLATVLYLQGRRLEAIRIWNGIDRPRLESVTYDPKSAVSPWLLERILRLNKGEPIRAEALLEAEWKLNRLLNSRGLRFELMPEKQRWNLHVFQPSESVFATELEWMIDNTITAAFNRQMHFHWRQPTGTTIDGQFRWRNGRERISSQFVLPFFFTDSDAVQFDFDLRREEWFRHQRLTISAESVKASYQYLFSGRKGITLSTRLTHQRLDVNRRHTQMLLDPYWMELSVEWNQAVGLDQGDTAKMEWRTALQTFRGLNDSRSKGRRIFSHVQIPWKLKPGDGPRLDFFAGASRSWNKVPFQAYTAFGVGPGESLLMRAHSTIRKDGQIGPLARDYVAFSAEYSRPTFNLWLLRFRGHLFNDVVRSAGDPLSIKPTEWFHDVGAGVGFGLAGKQYFKLLFAFDTQKDQFRVLITLS